MLNGDECVRVLIRFARNVAAAVPLEGRALLERRADVYEDSDILTRSRQAQCRRSNILDRSSRPQLQNPKDCDCRTWEKFRLARPKANVDLSGKRHGGLYDERLWSCKEDRAISLEH